ncbi:MAG: hypothetical protein IJ849_01635 [Selenomonadaceae bacterium]|nr:hypothetical protein [Selenomonadaceae bacterium]
MRLKFKRLCLCLAALLTLSSTVLAKEVTVEGVGLDRESALRDARRVAVEEVVGTFVDSRTLVENSMLQLDSIYTKSQGFVGKVTVLSEGAVAAGYQVRATIDVNQNPDPSLLAQVQAVVTLNDPRIAVIVLKDGAPGVHEERIESAIMDKLIAKNFTHIVDPKIVAGLQDARMLESLYDGRPTASVGGSYGADFAVLGKCRTTTEQVSIPDFKGGYKATALNSGRSEMTVKIVRLDTGAILETFTVDSSGLEFGGNRAETESIKAMAEDSAAKVEEKFRRIGARSNSSVQITAAGDYGKITALAEDIRRIAGVQNVVIREQASGRAIIDVDTSQTASAIVQMLKSQSKLGIFVDSVSASSAKLMVS